LTANNFSPSKRGHTGHGSNGYGAIQQPEGDNMAEHSNDSHSFSAKYPEGHLSVYRPKYQDNNNGSKYQYPDDLFVNSVERETTKVQVNSR